MKKKNVDSFLTEGQALVDKNLFLQAEKVAQSMIADFPNKYEGYHLRFLILMKKAERKQSKESKKNENTAQFKVVRLYLDEIPDIFSFTPQFLCDNMEWYSAQGKEKEFLALTESDDRYMQVIPNEVLKLKYRYLYEQHDTGYVEALKDLITKYPDIDAMIALMTLYFADQQYDKTVKLGADILNNCELNDRQMYLVLFYQIYSIYYMTDKNPPEEMAIWIKQAGLKCIKIADRFGDESAYNEVKSTLSDLMTQISVNKK